jgi:hypothetical protein
LRRTPLTDLLGNHPNLSTRKLSTRKPDTLKPGDLGRRGKSLAYGGTALALAGIGGVTAAAVTSAAPNAAAAVTSAAPDATGIASTSPSISVADAAGIASTSPSVSVADAAGALAGSSGSAHLAAAFEHAPAAPKASGAFGQLKVHPKSPHVVRHGTAKSWKQIRDELAGRMSVHVEPGKLPLADRLVIGPASGSQSYLPITSARMANATAIVREALGRRMGLRAAVIAVATAMQESALENISYGDRDSLGLFQQRPSMGWGSASQITTPSYAAGAFLRALAAHQKTDPGWAGQPLWATAQAVQRSGFPYAYAKWEKQAAQLVTVIATKLS